MKKLLKWWKSFIREVYLSDWFDPIYQKWTDWVRVPFENIKRIIAYLPILWKTREWDFYHTTEMWKFSLNRLEKGMRKGHCRHSEKKFRRMKIAQELLDRIGQGEDFYHEMIEKQLEKKYGKSEIKFLVEKEDPRWGKLYRMVDLREENWTSKQKEQYPKDRKKMYKEAKRLRERDVDLFAKIIKKYSSQFWD